LLVLEVGARLPGAAGADLLRGQRHRLVEQRLDEVHVGGEGGVEGLGRVEVRAAADAAVGEAPRAAQPGGRPGRLAHPGPQPRATIAGSERGASIASTPVTSAAYAISPVRVISLIVVLKENLSEIAGEACVRPLTTCVFSMRRSTSKVWVLPTRGTRRSRRAG